MRQFSTSMMSLILVMILFMVAACSDDDSPTNPGGTNPGTAPTFDSSVTTYTPPATMQSSSEQGAINAKGGIAFVNAAPLLATILTPPTKSAGVRGEKAGPWVRTWAINDGGINVTITLTITEVGDIYRWEYVVNGTDGEMTYVDVLLYAAEKAVDGSGGWIEFYDGPGEVAVWRWVFASSGGVTTSDMQNLDGSSGDRWELVTSSDGSGSIDYYNGLPWVLEFHASWNAAGVGMWEEYNPDGSVSDSGGWGVPTALGALLR
jgi:hypothetical protein